MSTITRIRWTDAEIIRALELFAKGLTHEAIGEYVGRTRFSIEGLIRDLRTRRTHADFWDDYEKALVERDKQILNGAQRFRWSAELDTLLMRLVREGKTNSEIARQLGVSRSALKMRRFKIKARGLSDEPGAFADPVLALAVSGSWRRAA
jgi:transposase-like protein